MRDANCEGGHGGPHGLRGSHGWQTAATAWVGETACHPLVADHARTTPPPQAGATRGDRRAQPRPRPAPGLCHDARAPAHGPLRPRAVLLERRYPAAARRKCLRYRRSESSDYRQSVGRHVLRSPWELDRALMPVGPQQIGHRARLALIQSATSCSSVNRNFRMRPKTACGGYHTVCPREGSLRRSQSA